MKRKKQLIERLSSPRALLGLLQMHPSPLIDEMAVTCGYDFVFLDGEHGLFAENDYARTLQTLNESNVLIVARIAGHDERELAERLAIGVDAVVVPNVSTPEEASELARAMDSQDKAALIVVIETRLGVSNVDDILGIDGVAAAIIGPSDLSADTGLRGSYAAPEYKEAITRIERAAAAKGKAVGTIPHGDLTLEKLVERGHRILILGTDRSLVRDAMNEQIRNARSCIRNLTE